jgi:uncharacterized protein
MVVLMQIEIIHITAAGDVVSDVVEVAQGTTVLQAVQKSGILRRVGKDAVAGFGIYGRVVESTVRVRDGDRVELYRSLVCDPKLMRRKRANK